MLLYGHRSGGVAVVAKLIDDVTPDNPNYGKVVISMECATCQRLGNTAPLDRPPTGTMAPILRQIILDHQSQHAHGDVCAPANLRTS